METKRHCTNEGVRNRVDEEIKVRKNWIRLIRIFVMVDVFLILLHNYIIYFLILDKMVGMAERRKKKANGHLKALYFIL